MSTTQQRSGPPSARFWVSKTNNLGAILALVAGLINVAVTIWPLVSATGPGDIAPTWRLVGLGAGVAYILAFIMADRAWLLARILLAVGAVAQILAALTLGRAFEAQGGLSGQLIGPLDFLPAILALIGAFLIGRAPTRAEARRM
jgi:hypothetical protein